MKKICVLGVSLLLFAAHADAQVMANDKKDVGPVHFGLEAGANINGLYRSDVDNYVTTNNSKWGWHGGFIVNFGTGKFSVQPGLRYILKGGENDRAYQDQYTRIDANSKLRLHYIQMPLNFIYNTGYWGSNRFMIGIGPYVSYLVGASTKVDVTTTNRETGAQTFVSTERDLTVGNNNGGAIERWDAGGQALIGYQFSGGLYVKATGSMGFVDLENWNVSPYRGYNRNYDFQLSLGYLFGYKCK